MRSPIVTSGNPKNLASPASQGGVENANRREQTQIRAHLLQLVWGKMGTQVARVSMHRQVYNRKQKFNYQDKDIKREVSLMNVGAHASEAFSALRRTSNASMRNVPAAEGVAEILRHNDDAGKCLCSCVVHTAAPCMLSEN